MCSDFVNKSQLMTMSGVGCWVLGVGCWVLGYGCWVLGAGCWVMGVGCWPLGWPYSIKRNSVLRNFTVVHDSSPPALLPRKVEIPFFI